METLNFGLTQLEPGESLAKNGWAPLGSDRELLDSLLVALKDHQHTAAPRLEDPVNGPTLTVFDTGGDLPGNTTYYYAISHLDRYGLETAISPEVEITTPVSIGSPEQPVLEIETTGGLVGPGSWAYAITFVDAQGGETVASRLTSISVTGTGTNRVKITLPVLPVGAVGHRIYRARPGQADPYFLMENISTDVVVYDVGEYCEVDPSLMPPTYDTTLSTSRVNIQVDDLPTDVTGWRIYRTEVPGVYDEYSLVAEVVEPIDGNSTIIRDNWDDDGSGTNRGVPRLRSATIDGGRIIDFEAMEGRMPRSAVPRGVRSLSMTALGGVLDNNVIYRTRLVEDIQPVAITVFFGLVPPSGSTSVATVRITDSVGKTVDIVTTGQQPYYVLEWPLTEGLTWEAEEGVKDPEASVMTLSEAGAYNGQVVELDLNESVTVEISSIDPGDYEAFARIKGTAIIEVLNAANAVIATRSITSAGLYAEGEALAFLSTSTQAARFIRVRNDSATKVYVDRIRFQAVLLTLAKGDIEVRTFWAAS